MTDPIYIRMTCVQRVFGFSRSTAYEAAARGIIKLHKVGRTTVLEVAEVKRAISEGRMKKICGGPAGGPAASARKKSA